MMSTLTELKQVLDKAFNDVEEAQAALVLAQARVGIEASRQRRRSGVSARQLAKEMKFSPSFVCDLEKGRRGWTVATLVHYLTCLQRLAKP